MEWKTQDKELRTRDEYSCSVSTEMLLTLSSFHSKGFFPHDLSRFSIDDDRELGVGDTSRAKFHV